MIVDTAMANKVMSKRNARTFVEDGMEKEPCESHPKKPAPRPEDGIMEKIERTTSSSSNSTNQLDLDTPATDRPDPPPATKGDHDVPAATFRKEDVSRPSIPDFTGPAGLGQALLYQKAPDVLSHRLNSRRCPVNFGIVVPGVYRSSYPRPQDYPFIKDLGLKTIITLVQKELPPAYKSFIKANNIQHHVFDMEGTKKAEIPAKTMKSILRLVLDQQNHPLLIHCNHGKHRTGCVVGVVRKLTGWDLSTILSEYKAYSEPKIRECDIKYITAFDLGTISNLFGKEPNWQLKTRNFFRVSLFTTFVLLLWVFSGKRIVTQSDPGRLG